MINMKRVLVGRKLSENTTYSIRMYRVPKVSTHQESLRNRKECVSPVITMSASLDILLQFCSLGVSLIFSRKSLKVFAYIII